MSGGSDAFVQAIQTHIPQQWIPFIDMSYFAVHAGNGKTMILK